jgi:HSP20 family molecular chaperone IbpA
MQRQTYDLMMDHVRSIYRAVTGSDLPHEVHGGEPPPPFGFDELLLRRFAELDACAHLVPDVGERVPPLSFAPAVEVIDRGSELVVQAAVPGVHEEDVSVELINGALVISGLRHGEPTNGQVYRHAEIPRGPFRRVLPLRTERPTEPLRVEVKDGLLRVVMAKHGAKGGAVAKA